MALIERPWTRVRQPVPIGAVTATSLQETTAADFAQLIRSNLMPRDQEPGGRRAWEQLWALLRADDELAGRTYDVLEDFLDVTQDALDAGDLQTETSRAEKFMGQCQQAWSRLERDEDGGHLAWAGSAGNFQPAAQRVIATLIGAIARHRTTLRRSPDEVSAADQELWAVMARVSLDPDDYPSSSRRPRRSPQ
jgi:hypothetical protein